MCGITGFVGFNDRTLVRKMNSVLVHRGPDDYGYFSDKNVELGHRRLSIIDLSRKGRQPMSNEEGSIWIIYNGEVYNFQELREELEKKGHHFKSNTDTEVIVHAYEEYGESCVEKFNGMFAFAIWDSKAKKLFLARDRLGIKPIYYHFDGENFFFASEIKALLENKEIKRKVNEKALPYYLAYPYIPAPITIFSGIKKLPAAHTLTYKNKKIGIKRYWKLNFGVSREDGKGLFNLLRSSVNYRLISDVPLGLNLSGGLDSSTIAALMCTLRNPEEVKTFSVGYAEGKNELEYARIVAEHLGTDHKEVILESKIGKILPKIAYHSDEPVSDAASIPKYELAKKTSKYNTVILVGEGSDELFAGYLQHRVMYIADRYGKIIPKNLRDFLGYGLRKINGFNSNSKFSKYVSFGSKFIPSIGDEEKGYKLIISNFIQKDILLKDVGGAEVKQFKEAFSLKTHILNRLLSLETTTLLPEAFLMNIDRMTMAFSVEARVPFLDYRVVEYSASLSPQARLGLGWQEKRILKKVMKKYLPKVTLKRRKYPFIVPLREWFDAELMDITKQLLDKKEISHKFFNQVKIERLFQKKDYVKLYSLTMFELWHKQFIKQ